MFPCLFIQKKHFLHVFFIKSFMKQTLNQHYKGQCILTTLLLCFTFLTQTHFHSFIISCCFHVHIFTVNYCSWSSMEYINNLDYWVNEDFSVKQKNWETWHHVALMKCTLYWLHCISFNGADNRLYWSCTDIVIDTDMDVCIISPAINTLLCSVCVCVCHQDDCWPGVIKQTP